MTSIKELRKICQAPEDCHNFKSYFHNKIWRVLSIYITKLLIYTPLKPNHVTFIMVFWGFIVGFLFSIGTYWYMLLGAIVLEFLLVLDCVDGELARYKKIFSLNGIFLDSVAHLTNLAIPFIGITIGLYKSNPDIHVVLIGLSASVFSMLCLNIQSLKYYVFFRELVKYANKTERIKSKKIPQKEIIKKPQKENILKSIGKTINFLYDGVYIIQIIFLAAVFDQLYWVLVFYGLISPLMWLAKLIYEYKIGYKHYEYLFRLYKK